MYNWHTTNCSIRAHSRDDKQQIKQLQNIMKDAASVKSQYCDFKMCN